MMKSKIFSLFVSSIGALSPNPALATHGFAQPRAPGMIYGHCTLLAGHGNSLPRACSGVLLILSRPSGEVLARTTTDERGNFLFKAENNRKYVISSGSDAYEISSPKNLVVGGDVLDLKLNAR